VTNESLPNPKPGATDVAKLATGIGIAVASIAYPPAALAAPFLNFAIDRFIKRSEKILVEGMKSGNFRDLDLEKAAEFVPMAYKFFEAAKEGEYEHNLRILAAYIASEMGEEAPDAPSFARMARRLEGLTKTDLKVIALINSSLSRATHVKTTADRPYVSAHQLAHSPNNSDKLNRIEIQEALTELTSRGLLMPDGASRLDKAEEYYFTSQAFTDLIARTKNTIEKETGAADNSR
jgi:hypothetical protein